MNYDNGVSVSYSYDAVGNRTTKTVVGGVVPVEWLSFIAYPETENGNKSILKWSTASEDNCSHYEIEHSTDGKTFTIIGEQTGAGTTIEQQDYEFIHNEPIIGINYYRIKQVDFDEVFEYSKVVAVEFELVLPKLTMNLFPNPTSGILNIEVGEITGTPTFQVFDISGRLIEVVINTVSSNQWSFNTTSLPTGNYFLQMKQGEQILNKKFVLIK